jgi:hypothetical protein
VGALICGHDEPTTSKELWDTGLGDTMSRELLAALRSDDLPTIVDALLQWLKVEDGAFLIKNDRGDPVLHARASSGVSLRPGFSFRLPLPLTPNVGEQMCSGDALGNYNRIWRCAWDLLYHCSSVFGEVITIAILRVLVMKDLRPTTFDCSIATEAMGIGTLMANHAQVVQEWARLQARLPVYLAQRWALGSEHQAYLDQRWALRSEHLDEHCPLIPPLRALILGYLELSTSEELWATGLGDE